MGAHLRRAVPVVVLAVMVAAGVGACTVEERPADQRQSVQTTPQPDPVTSQIPPVPPTP